MSLIVLLAMNHACSIWNYEIKSQHCCVSFIQKKNVAYVDVGVFLHFMVKLVGYINYFSHKFFEAAIMLDVFS